MCSQGKLRVTTCLYWSLRNLLVLELTKRTVYVCSRGISGCSSLLYSRPGQEAVGRDPLQQQQQQRRPAEKAVLTATKCGAQRRQWM